MLDSSTLNELGQMLCSEVTDKTVSNIKDCVIGFKNKTANIVWPGLNIALRSKDEPNQANSILWYTSK